MTSCSTCADKDQRLVLLRQELETFRQKISDQQQPKQQHRDGEEQQSPNEKHSPFLSNHGQLTKPEVERYSRQALLPECGPEGTKAFINSRVVVIGCGGLGSTAILYLAASGIGHLVLVDADVVDRSNLHRQIIQPDCRTVQPKVESAKLSALALNPTIKIDTFQERFTVENAEKICQDATIVLDCSDNVATRYLVNDICVRKGLALVSGAAMRWDGQLSVYNLPLNVEGLSKTADDVKNLGANVTNRSPTYRCMHPNPPPVSTLGGCSDIGVFGPVPGLIGILQALEALKSILWIESLKMARDKKLKEGDKSLVFSASTINNNNNNNNNNQPLCNVIAGKMLVWDAFMGSVRTMKMRPRCESGVVEAITGPLKGMGSEYDGCTLEIVSDPEVQIEGIEPRRIIKEKKMQQLPENVQGGEQQQLLSSGQRRQRQQPQQQNDGDDDNENEDDERKTVAHVKNELKLYLQEKKRQHNSTNRCLNVCLFLDVRKPIQRRLCALEDLYVLPSLIQENDENNDNNKTLVLHLGVSLTELEKKFTPFLDAFARDIANTNNNKTGEDGALQNNRDGDRSSSIEHEVSLEVLLSELLLIGPCSTKEISQQSEYLRDLITPEMIENFEILSLCRRGIDSAKAIILLEKLRRLVRNFRGGKNAQSGGTLYAAGKNSQEKNTLQEDKETSTREDVFSTCLDLFSEAKRFSLKNVTGGLNRWSLDADEDFPFY